MPDEEDNGFDDEETIPADEEDPALPVDAPRTFRVVIIRRRRPREPFEDEE